jgi:hypothetical protein
MIAAGLKRCVLCGSRRKTRQHHIGGQNHISWLTMLVCEPCHETFHARFRQSVDYRFTPNSKMRLIRAMQAVLVFLWVLLEMLVKEMRSEAGQ